MSKTLACDSNNDLYIDKYGNIAIVSGRQSVLECCAHAMKTISKECVFDQPRGIPYFEAVWSGSPNIQQFNFASIQALSAVADVVSVPDFTSVVSDNKVSYRAVIETIYGTGIIEQ